MYSKNDFTIPYWDGMDNNLSISNKLVYSQTVRRTKGKKPCIMGVFGESGSGKSTAAIKLQQRILEMQGLDIRDYLDDINVFVPFEFATKFKRILFDKKLKKINVICIHEARDVLNSKDWNTFVARALAKINTQSRQIKPLIIMIISQYASDITSETRKTLTDYVTADRGLSSPGYITWQKTYLDMRDPEKPKLRLRRLKGYLAKVEKDNVVSKKKIYPKRIYIGLPDRDVVEKFENADLEAKKEIIDRDLDRLMKELAKKHGIQDDVKIDSMVEYYSKDMDKLSLVGKIFKGKLKIKPSFRTMHDLTENEEERFTKKINEKMKTMQKINEEEDFKEE